MKHNWQQPALKPTFAQYWGNHISHDATIYLIRWEHVSSIKSNHVIDVIGLTEDLDADHDGEPDEDEGDLEEARNGLVLLALKDLKDDDVQDGAAGNAWKVRL